ncbi:serine/threonine-protein kinase-like protein [Byssothecium circinans]|uniref:Serine/threonine-protein kinase-like protein n=1 Tax=Byssothecium circinans TaxID=147558 RepID=A0A6A5UBB7_9PLEO|nr:serine/threonine-protein kinase-like protein [Byssothecium circinans]
MEVVDFAEVFDDQDDIFSHTEVILKKGQEHYRAVTTGRFDNASEIALETLDCHLIPLSYIQPTFPPNLTRAPEPLPPNTYVKRPSLYCFSPSTKDVVLHEAQMCEILRKSSHPNIAEYIGCLVEDGRIAGLCFRQYGANLLNLKREGHTFDREACLRDIKEGITHLHRLGIIHCDINPMNIFSDPVHGSFVIGDFDSCALEDQELGMKIGTKGWTKEGFCIAKREMDWYGLSRIEEELFSEDTSNR